MNWKSSDTVDNFSWFWHCSSISDDIITCTNNGQPVSRHPPDIFTLFLWFIQQFAAFWAMLSLSMPADSLQQTGHRQKMHYYFTEVSTLFPFQTTVNSNNHPTSSSSCHDFTKNTIPEYKLKLAFRIEHQRKLPVACFLKLFMRPKIWSHAWNPTDIVIRATTELNCHDCRLCKFDNAKFNDSVSIFQRFVVVGCVRRVDNTTTTVSVLFRWFI